MQKRSISGYISDSFSEKALPAEATNPVQNVSLRDSAPLHPEANHPCNLMPIQATIDTRNQHHGEPARRGAPLTAGKPGMHYVIEKINVMESLHDRVPSLIID
eukprot:1160637-Pelagomonas_calceolata.AAC.7